MFAIHFYAHIFTYCSPPNLALLEDGKFTDVADIDLDNVFLHYTNEKNLANISKNGLKPKIGTNSRVIEKSKKVFFSAGDQGALVIIDVWIKWLWVKPKSNFIYKMGLWLMKHHLVPKFLPQLIGYFNKINKRKTKWCYHKMKGILDRSIYLVLDLEKGVDYDPKDVDEAKAYLNISKDFFESVYAFDSDIENPQMEYWNMHTISGKTISPTKLSILTYKGSQTASNIIKYLIEENLEFVRKNCDKLYGYYRYFYQA